MTEPKPQDETHYVGILEAVVAVLAIKCGLNPNTMMARAIEDITEQTGMETLETERIIRDRWTGRQLSAAVFAAQRLPSQLAPTPQRATETAEPVPMGSRLAEYKKRQSEGQSDSPV